MYKHIHDQIVLADFKNHALKLLIYKQDPCKIARLENVRAGGIGKATAGLPQAGLSQATAAFTISFHTVFSDPNTAVMADLWPAFPPICMSSASRL